MQRHCAVVRHLKKIGARCFPYLDGSRHFLRLTAFWSDYLADDGDRSNES